MEIREEETRKRLMDCIESSPNFLVEAGAGAGKTYILVERIVNQLRTTHSVDEIVAITFTNKSTQELQMRIRKRLEECLKDSGITEDEKYKIEGIIDQLGRMQISTIHSFCQTMLKLVPFESELGVEFENVIRDQNQEMKEFLNKKRKSNPEKFHILNQLGVNTRCVEDNFKSICNGNEDVKVVYSHEDSEEYKALLDEFRTKASLLYPDIKKAVENIFLADKNKDIVDTRFKELLELNGNMSDVEWIEWVRLLTNSKTSFCKKYATSSIQSKFRANRKKLVEIIDQSDWNNLKKLAGVLLHSKVMNLLVPLVEEFHKQQIQNQCITENDLLVYARNMLRDSECARAYLQKRYKVIYVDEFQDTDPIQVQILFYLTAKTYHSDWKLCIPEEGSLFLVGDPKQAIYRFRGADISLYTQVRQRFTKDDIGDVVVLQRNFRSYKRICDLADEMFDPNYVGDIGNDNPDKIKRFIGENKDIKDIHKSISKCETEIGKIEVNIEKYRNKIEMYNQLKETKSMQNKQAVIEKTKDEILELEGKISQLRVEGKDTAGNEKRINTKKAKLQTEEAKYEELKANEIKKNQTLKKEIEEKIQNELKSMDEKKKEFSAKEQSLENTINENLLTWSDQLQELKMQGDSYQVSYTPMVSEKGESPNSKTYYYHCGDKDEDPKYVARLITRMIRNKEVEVYQYSDFLILTKTKKEAHKYETALRENEIPCMVSGEQDLKEIPELELGRCFLQVLVEPYNAVALLKLLYSIYGVELPTIRCFLRMSTISNLVIALKTRENLEHVMEHANLDDMGEKIKELCQIGHLLIDMSWKARNVSPMGVVEEIFDTIYYENDVRRNYGYVQQFLNAIREEPQGTLEEYYELIEQKLSGSVESGLELETESNCVRIMNLHKVKGLEGKVVILTYGSSRDIDASTHMERTEDGTINLYYTFGIGGYFGEKNIIPVGWDEKKAEEEKFLKAEQARLLYVAVTRAESQLIVNASPYWEKIAHYCDEIEEAGYEVDVQENQMVTNDSKEESAYSIPQYKFMIEAQTGLKEKQEKVSQNGSVAITPSSLDHGAPRKKKEEIEDEQEIYQEEVEESVDNQERVEKQVHHEGPKGRFWGTIVHRTLELVVRGNYQEVEKWHDYATQAIQETLEDPLTYEQVKQLFAPKDTTQLDTTLTDNRVKELSDKVVAGIGFLQDDNNQIKQLIQKGTLFPEMTFFTSVEEGDLYEHLCQHMKKVEVNGKRLDVQGIIDLAILTEEGWIVVDYKTDGVKPKETEESYCERLQEEYTNQLHAYGKLLELATGKKVVGLYLCSIPFAGKCVGV